MLTVSTYWSSMMCNKSVSLLLPELMILRRLPPKRLAKKVPMKMPSTTLSASHSGMKRYVFLLFILFLSL